MTTPPSGSQSVNIYRIDPSLIERQQDRYAGRALGYLILLNGTAAILMMAAFALNFQSTEPKLVSAMLAVIASAASFLTGLNMVGTATTSRSSTHPKTKLQDRGLASLSWSTPGNKIGMSSAAPASAAKASAGAEPSAL